jgi:hypothetical protein
LTTQFTLSREDLFDYSRCPKIVSIKSREILADTVAGIAKVRKLVIEEYGQVEVIGRGGCKNGPFPGEALPDFVAMSPKHKQPILVEVKNTPRPVSTDRVQATFYNTVARETGVVVQEQRFESGKLNLVPLAHHESIADTILIYPRASSFERVTDQLDLKEETLRNVWTAKQLGFIGQSPRTDCDSKCPHHRLSIELPVGSLEAAPPLPLIFAQGLIEEGVDLDGNYLHNYFYKSGLGSDLFRWILRAERESELKRDVIDRVSSKTALPKEMVERMVFSRGPFVDPNTILKRMEGEIEPWTKILEKGQLKAAGPVLQRLVSRIYSLPDGSAKFVKKSSKKWKV